MKQKEMTKSFQSRPARKKRWKPSVALVYLFLIFWAMTTVYPIIWVFQNSFKAKDKILSNSFSLPVGNLYTTANYRKAFQNLDIFSAYKNSVFISCVVCAGVVLLAGLAAFALVRYRFKLRNTLSTLVVAGMMFPVFATIIPVYTMETSWEIVNTRNWWLSMLSVILPQIAGNLSFAIVVLTGYIKGLPIELEEAAFLEGCGPIQIFFKVIIPLTKPAFATVAIFSFLWSYNDLFTQMFFLRRPETRAITRLLNDLTSQEGEMVINWVCPDILFSDIRMPGVDGLSMIAALKSQHPDMEITILTGFRDFEYARQAIRLGVTRYLLKPSKMDELTEAIEAMVAQLDQRTAARKKAPVDAVQSEQPETEQTEPPQPEEELQESAAGSFIVNNALQYIAENYREKLKLSDVAEHVYVSQWHLSKLLNRYTEKSFSDILNHVRIEKAKELLADLSLRIGDIAEQVGFLDMAHFSRVFKKMTGHSANEYRNLMQGRKR